MTVIIIVIITITVAVIKVILADQSAIDQGGRYVLQGTSKKVKSTQADQATTQPEAKSRGWSVHTFTAASRPVLRPSGPKGGRWSVGGDRRHRRVRLRGCIGDSSYPSVPSCFSLYCISALDSSSPMPALCCNLIERISTEDADPRGDLVD